MASIKFLIAAGADVNAKSTLGKPLDTVISAKDGTLLHPELSELLAILRAAGARCMYDDRIRGY